MFRLTQDNDGHWYVIPVDKESDFEEYIEAIENYWQVEADGDEQEPERPEWLIDVGGAPSRVSFPSYEIK